VPVERQEELIAELWALETTGVHLRPEGGEEIVDAFFPAEARPELLSGPIWSRCDAELLEVGDVESEDWLARYRALSRPLDIGRFRIDPREPREMDAREPDPTRIDLRIPARNAFGTGSHESTRLVLEVMPALEVEARSVLDVGTGSGILSLAALRLGASIAVGFDMDVGSVVTARDNATLNHAFPRLFAGRIGALAGRFDVLLVNVLPHRWLPDAPAVVECLRPAGDLVVSGLLTSEVPSMLGTLEPLGLTHLEERKADEWSALRLSRSAGI